MCLVQETKLRPTHRTPTMQGYGTVRSDRKGSIGGGLIIYIKNTLVFEKVQESNKEGTESITIRVKSARRKWINITNVYIPPANTTSSVAMRTANIPATENSLILGDLNGHSLLWDFIQPSDKRGEEIEKWVIDESLAVLNDGTPTRVNRITGGESAPDVSLVGKKWYNKCSWSTCEGIGNSDHLPILVTINASIQHQSIFGKAARWRKNGVDWNAFRQEAEATCDTFTSEQNATVRVLRFNTALIEAAQKHVGKTKPGPRTKTHMTPTVRAALKKRNKLRKDVKNNRQAWLDACKEAQEEINNAKEDSWRDLLEDTMEEANDSKLWGVIKSLNGTPETNSPNEAMKHKGKTITSSEKKAEIFAKHYASVSRHKFTKEERDTNREFKKRLRSTAGKDADWRPFTMAELKRAIKKMKRKSAAGPDGIPPSFLKELGPSALTELLGISNACFSGSLCPQIWRLAHIIPLLKAGKPASDLASYRPISLTSCIVKALERMVNDRLYYLAESQGWFHPAQAGFRKGRGCDDQIARVIQEIQDGFQHSPFKRSVIVLLDFSKAYDTVWKEKLLLSMLDQGVPSPYVRWLNSFLMNREAKVRINGRLGKAARMRQGLPQGSVLSPILFLFYINNLAKILPTEITNSLFADDVTLLATCDTLKEAEELVQKSVDVVTTWSKEWKISLNATKSEASFFSNSNLETAAKWKPKIVIDGKAIKYNPTPRLLGVILDRTLCFGPHVTSVEKQAAPKIRTIACLSHSTWGWRKEYLQRIYSANIKSIINYAGFAWQSCLSDTQIKTLERLQYRAIRAVTGQSMSTPCEALPLEIGDQSLRTEFKRNAAIATEKALRLPSDHPRRIAFEQTDTRRRSRRRAGEHLPGTF